MRLLNLKKIIVILIFVSFTINITTHSIPAQTFSETNTIHLEFYGIPNNNYQEITLTEEQEKSLISIIKNANNLQKKSKENELTFVDFHSILKQLYQSSIVTKKQYQSVKQTLTIFDFLGENIQQQDNQNSTNYLSLVIGHTTNTHMLNIMQLGCTTINYFIIIAHFIAQFIGLGDTLYSLFELIKEKHTTYQTIRPDFLPSIGIIAFGTRQISPSPPNQLKTYPATGWVTSKGITGSSNINGSFIGSIRSVRSPLHSYLTYFFGLSGFIGLSIRQNDGSTFFLGFTLQQKTIYWPQPPYP